MKAPRSSRPAAADYPQIEVGSRTELRDWLAGAHATSRGAWVVTWKKHVADKYVDAAAVAEEALCVGWIDSLPRALDDVRTMLLVTPRQAKSAWSAVNKQRVARLVAPGALPRITSVGVPGSSLSATGYALLPSAHLLFRIHGAPAPPARVMGEGSFGWGPEGQVHAARSATYIRRR